MLKMTKKTLLVIGALLCIAGIGSAAYASFYVYSNVTGPIRIQYVATVDTSAYPTIKVTASGYYGNVPDGTTVYLYYYENTIAGSAPGWNGGVGWTEWTTATTTGGVATFTFDAPNNLVDYYFVAYYYVS
jgi:hypothetical protein